MRLNEVRYDTGLPVEGYGRGFFRVAGRVMEGAIAITPAGAAPWGGYGDTATLTVAAVDIVFVGTGAEVAHLPADFVAALDAAGIAAEGMASPAACRTYNVLLSEGRRVGLAVLPV